MSDCEETAGFLFKHPCGRAAAGTCVDCDKPICGKHTKQVEQAKVCVSCAKILLEQGKPGQHRRRTGREAYGRYANDPYFYGYSYYEGYGDYDEGSWGHEYYAETTGNDPSDFTEADGESFQVEADEDFETDMGAS